MAIAGIDESAVTAWLLANVDGLVPPLAFSLIEGGNSNLTYRVEDAEGSFALRRPPLGHVLESAHDMAREFRVISALRDTAVPVPDALALCAPTSGSTMRPSTSWNSSTAWCPRTPTRGR